MKIFVDLSPSSRLVNFKITSRGVILSLLLIGESMKDKLGASKEEMLAMHYSCTVAALTILSCYLAFNLGEHLGINFTSIP